MKKLLERMKSYSFWVSLTGALIIFLNCLGNIFGFKIENAVVENVIMSFAGILVVFGLVTKDTPKNEEDTEEDDKNDENSDEPLKNKCQMKKKIMKKTMLKNKKIVTKETAFQKVNMKKMLKKKI